MQKNQNETRPEVGFTQPPVAETQTPESAAIADASGFAAPPGETQPAAEVSQMGQSPATAALPDGPTPDGGDPLAEKSPEENPEPNPDEKLEESAEENSVPVTNMFPAHCPHCGSTARQRLECVRPRKGPIRFHGVIYDGFTVSYTRCRKCGKRYAVRQYIQNGQADS